jgi:bacteriorhodopsin
LIVTIHFVVYVLVSDARTGAALIAIRAVARIAFIMFFVYLTILGDFDWYCGVSVRFKKWHIQQSRPVAGGG